MAGIFTQHVRDLSSGASIGSEILDEIQAVLRSELRRRSILQYGPSLLGYHGQSWDDRDAMDDLVQDCYVRAIATRLAGLLRNLEKSRDIDRLIRRNIRSFVGERQASLDPTGYAIFQNIKAVAVAMTDGCELIRSESEDAPISATSEFRFPHAADSAPTDDTGLREALRTTGTLFDGLELLQGVGIGAQQHLLECLRGLPNQGVTCFSVGVLKRCLMELISEAGLSTDVRGASFSSIEQEFLESFRTVPPDAGYEELEHVEQLTASIRQEIAALPRSESVKTRLVRLLDHLSEITRHDSVQEVGTLDELAEHFGASRSTMHDDFQSLRALVQRFRNAIAPQ